MGIKQTVNPLLNPPVNDALRHAFKPEFLNRIDDIIVFRPLDRGHLRHIVDLQLKQVADLLAVRQIKLQVTEEAKEFLIMEGYDPAYGARPLKRVIQRRVQNPLALAILEGTFGEGDTLRVGRNVETGELEFTAVPVTAVEDERASA